MTSNPAGNPPGNPPGSPTDAVSGAGTGAVTGAPGETQPEFTPLSPAPHTAAAGGANPGRASGRPVLVTCLSVALGVLLLLVGFGFGYGVGRFNGSPALAAAQNGKSGEALYPKFDVFWEAMDLLYNDFYGKLPDSSAATYGAIRGVLGELDDHNTSFMTPQEAEFFRSHLEGSFEGIGARVDWDQTHNTLRIVEPFENQPAWKAGVKRDDLVVAVDGATIVGTDLTSAIEKIRGPKGSTVKLTVVREGVPDPFDVDVIRDRIEIPTIAAKTVGGDIAYVQLNSFNENAGELVKQAVADALAQNPKGLIFDLRGNPGGLLSQAVEVANVFLEDQPVLIERFADGKEEIYRTKGPATAKDIPLVVLVNEGSASASEIVAGAVQDYGRGQMVGVKTYGKGSVQLPQTLSDGSIMRVTVARWFTPKDRTIDGTGLEPDVTVAFTEEDRTAGKDPQLDKAIELLGGDPAATPVQ